MSERTLVLGTRGSALALRQARLVRDRLNDQGLSVDLQVIKTTGDRILDVPLSDVGDKALFTKELDVALLEGSIQLAVHSLKDLPTRLPPGLTLAAVTERVDPRDVFIGHAAYEGGLHDLPEGATVATASLRRRAQLKAWRGDLDIVPVRGNVDTRLEKLDASEWSGIVLAAAGLLRLGLDERITDYIDGEIMLSAVGQGALGIVCAEDDEATQTVLRGRLDHADTRNAVIAERAFLRRLEGGCSVPVGCYAHTHNRVLNVEGCVADLEGRRIYRSERRGEIDAADEMGTDLAEELLERGADAILNEIRERNG